MNGRRAAPPARVLVVDDDVRYSDLLMLAANFGASPEDPGAHGLSLLRRLRDQPATPAVVALAEAGNELTAVRALPLGAVDYLPKRLLTPELLSTAVRVALRRVERRVARRLASLANLSRDQAHGMPANAAAQNAPDADAGAVDAAGAAQAPATEGAEAEALQPAGVAALLAAANAEVIPG